MYMVKFQKTPVAAFSGNLNWNSELTLGKRQYHQLSIANKLLNRTQINTFRMVSMIMSALCSWEQTLNFQCPNENYQYQHSPSSCTLNIVLLLDILKILGKWKHLKKVFCRKLDIFVIICAFLLSMAMDLEILLLENSFKLIGIFYDSTN